MKRSNNPLPCIGYLTIDYYLDHKRQKRATCKPKKDSKPQCSMPTLYISLETSLPTTPLPF